MTHRPTILLTGASGVLGRALIDELSRDHDLVALRHRTHVADARVTELSGSLAGPQLGLTHREHHDLLRRVDVVVHAAAATNWKADPEHIRQTNVSSTSSMLAFAERAQVPMHFVSTAFVANPPRAMGDRFAGAAGYIASKIEAEQLTRESTVPTVIVRPSVVIGDSRDGRMASFQGLHRIAGMIARGMVPLIACDPETLIDTVPQDLVAAAMGHLLRQGVQHGEFWLTAGKSAVTAADILTVSLTLGKRLGMDPSAPRFIPAEAVDRLLLPLLEDAISPELRRMFAELLESTWLFQMPRAIPTSLIELGFAEQVTRARLRSAFELSMDYWARAKGLLSVEPGPDQTQELAS
jgi:thioester reductase-like protein